MVIFCLYINSINSWDNNIIILGIQVPSYDMNAYSVSKSGLNHLTKLMAKQLAPFNITVNAILPGYSTFFSSFYILKQNQNKTLNFK